MCHSMCHSSEKSKKVEIIHLVFIGRTSEKRQVNQKYELKVGTYHTREDAKKHYDEVMEFLRSSEPIFLGFPSQSRRFKNARRKMAEIHSVFIGICYQPLGIYNKILLSSAVLDKRNGKGKLQIGNFLIRTSKVFAISELEEATLNQNDNPIKDNSKLLKLQLHLNNKTLTVCKYAPPYDDDKMIVALVQHARLINWWKDDNFNKYGERVLKET